MFGENKIEKADDGNGAWLTVNSIFATFQGEGPSCGVPAIFIRLGGCNLACKYCDTDFTTGNKRMKIEDIYQRVAELMRFVEQAFPLVVITGGEPLRQQVVPLLGMLHQGGCKIDIETSGSMYPSGLLEYYMLNQPEINLICSPKTGKVREELLPMIRAWKYIIRDGEVAEDGLPNTIPSTEKKMNVARPPRHVNTLDVFVQPCDDQDPLRNDAHREAAMRSAVKYGYRLSVQIHKVLGIE